VTAGRRYEVRPADVLTPDRRDDKLSVLVPILATDDATVSGRLAETVTSEDADIVPIGELDIKLIGEFDIVPIRVDAPIGVVDIVPIGEADNVPIAVTDTGGDPAGELRGVVLGVNVLPCRGRGDIFFNPEGIIRSELLVLPVVLDSRGVDDKLDIENGGADDLLEDLDNLEIFNCEDEVCASNCRPSDEYLWLAALRLRGVSDCP